MASVEAKSKPQTAEPDREVAWPPGLAPPAVARRRRRILPVFVTLVAVGIALWFGRAMWNTYMEAPWTRDGTVLAYVVTMAPEVAGRVVALPVADNQYVHKGDLLLTIDPTDYAIAVTQTQAAADQAEANAENAAREARRRAELTTLETSQEQQQTFAANAVATAATYRQALANLAQAKVNLERTSIRSPVNGYVTNLTVQLGDYANVGTNLISVLNADSYWIYGYFEETSLGGIQAGDPATIKLMGYHEPLQGHVDSIARGITVANAQAGQLGLANVNPIFTWVRLAQRIPVRIHIDHVPPGVLLAAGETATVQIEPGSRSPAK